MRRLEVETVRGMIRDRANEERAVKEATGMNDYELVLNILTVFALGIIAGIALTASVVLGN